MNRILEKLGIRRTTENQHEVLYIPSIKVVDSLEEANINEFMEGDYILNRKDGNYYTKINGNRFEEIYFL